MRMMPLQLVTLASASLFSLNASARDCTDTDLTPYHLDRIEFGWQPAEVSAFLLCEPSSVSDGEMDRLKRPVRFATWSTNSKSLVVKFVNGRAIDKHGYRLEWLPPQPQPVPPASYDSASHILSVPAIEVRASGSGSATTSPVSPVGVPTGNGGSSSGSSSLPGLSPAPGRYVEARLLFNPDGSWRWLSASSDLHYPLSQTGGVVIARYDWSRTAPAVLDSGLNLLTLPALTLDGVANGPLMVKAKPEGSWSVYRAGQADAALLQSGVISAYAGIGPRTIFTLQDAGQHYAWRGGSDCNFPASADSRPLLSAARPATGTPGQPGYVPEQAAVYGPPAIAPIPPASIYRIDNDFLLTLGGSRDSCSVQRLF
ncbi:hypothetical protein [Parachitinimonas caeni]|uniref:Secreted protein n=1 Tax=Parachitinimonas caeni TaxID=3031301 RepID=A0ABT7E314_9NEIS|nr:hypothetical protein [Parachitinimonas caeni]MDK2126712.1 hypothetical protein [Parachitinimonas caeni]